MNQNNILYGFNRDTFMSWTKGAFMEKYEATNYKVRI